MGEFRREPRRANDSIHSFMPTSPTRLPTSNVPSSLPFYTHCLFFKESSTHPLSHIITRPLWKCASLQTLDVTTSRSPQAERACRKKRGLVMAAKESHPTHNYYYPRPIHSLQMPL